MYYTDKTLSTAPAFTPLQQKILTRLREMEDDLATRDVHTVAGAEVEFFLQSANGRPFLKRIDREALKQKLQQRFPAVTKVDIEASGEIGEYEILLGGTTATGKVGTLAPQLHALRHALPIILNEDFNIPKVSFEAAPDYSRHLSRMFAETATASTHINLSAWSKHGDNLFCQDETSFSGLSLKSVATLIKLQEEGLALYVPDPKSYARMGKYTFAPSLFQIYEGKGGTVALRCKDSPASEPHPSYYRMEDRLAGADADPLFPLLAGVGAIWRAARREDTELPTPENINGSNRIIEKRESPHLRHSRAKNDLQRSTLWREIAGEDLFEDIVASQKSWLQSMRR